FVQRQLAASLRLLAEGGRDAFYKGQIAGDISRYMRASGGYLTREDFAGHQGNWDEPVSTDYHGYAVYQVPPNSQGFTALLALNILEHFNFGGIA
ncbi:gamma-glutamyltransferase, partial [Paenibacillus sonchi]